MTSAAVVAVVKRAVSVKRVGHTGTLDPMATGVLPICIGEATKLAGFLTADDKVYSGELELGADTDTLDAEGTIVRERRDEAAGVTEAALRAAMAAMVGDSMQMPPMFSAVRIKGRRLHELARAGETVERPLRAIRVERFELTGFDSPRATFEVHCSKGTYVRTLVSDVGEGLGSGAHLTALRRTRSGNFEIGQAITLDDVRDRFDLAWLIPPPEAASQFPAFTVPEARVQQIANGLQLRWEQLDLADEHPNSLFCLLTPAGALLAVAQLDGGLLSYERVFTYGLT